MFIGLCDLEGIPLVLEVKFNAKSNEVSWISQTGLKSWFKLANVNKVGVSMFFCAFSNFRLGYKTLVTSSLSTSFQPDN